MDTDNAPETAPRRHGDDDTLPSDCRRPAGVYDNNDTTTTTAGTTTTTGDDLDVLNVESALNWDRLEEQLRNALQLERCAEVGMLDHFIRVLFSSYPPFMALNGLCADVPLRNYSLTLGYS